MKKFLKSALLPKVLVMLLLMSLAWTFYAQAQATPEAPATNSIGNAAAPASTSSPAVWLTFGLDRVSWLQHRPIANIPLWQFLASLLYIFLAFYFSKALDTFIRNRLLKWAAKTQTNIDDMLINLVRGPVKVVSFVILLHIGMQVYSWPEGLAKILSAALKIIVACSITYVVLKAVDLFMSVWRERSRAADNEEFSRHLLPLIGKTLKVFVIVVAVLVTSQNLGLNVTGLIASLSIGGLALGLAAQDTLANLFGAVAVLMDKPFKVGDYVKLESVEGTVESIGFRSTRVRNVDGHLVTVPNKTMGNATITNVSCRPNIKTVINFGITYDTPSEKVQRAIAILEEIYRAHPMTHDVWITFDKFNDSSLNLLVVHWWKSTVYKDYLAGMQQLNLKIKERFDAESIEFAFPTRTIYLQNPAETGNGEPPFARMASGQSPGPGSASP